MPSQRGQAIVTYHGSRWLGTTVTAPCSVLPAASAYKSVYRMGHINCYITCEWPRARPLSISRLRVRPAKAIPSICGSILSITKRSGCSSEPSSSGTSLPRLLSSGSSTRTHRRPRSLVTGRPAPMRKRSLEPGPDVSLSLIGKCRPDPPVSATQACRDRPSTLSMRGAGLAAPPRTTGPRSEPTAGGARCTASSPPHRERLALSDPSRLYTR